VVPEEEEVTETQTTPAGAEIPVPEREDVMAAFRKVAKADDTTEDETAD
jgi:hypothetical protein